MKPVMKKDLHPKWHECKVSCDCGNSFTVGATVPSLKVEICSSCHPFFTKKQKFIDTAGRIDRFNAKFGQSSLSDIMKKKKTKESPSEKSEAL
tara:strand:+ start:1272 stop:1550 length:279 start_codon:yes stop_codon:yes gene_type:complete